MRGRSRVDGAADAPFLGTHLARLVRALVVVTHQMQSAVDQESEHLVFEAPTAAASLARIAADADERDEARELLAGVLPAFANTDWVVAGDWTGSPNVDPVTVYWNRRSQFRIDTGPLSPDSGTFGIYVVYEGESAAVLEASIRLAAKAGDPSARSRLRVRSNSSIFMPWSSTGTPSIPARTIRSCRSIATEWNGLR